MRPFLCVIISWKFFIFFFDRMILLRIIRLPVLQVAEIVKDRPSWYRDCRRLDVHTVIPVGNGGSIELLHMQVFFSF